MVTHCTALSLFSGTFSVSLSVSRVWMSQEKNLFLYILTLLNASSKRIKNVEFASYSRLFIHLDKYCRPVFLISFNWIHIGPNSNASTVY